MIAPLPYECAIIKRTERMTLVEPLRIVLTPAMLHGKAARKRDNYVRTAWRAARKLATS